MFHCIFEGERPTNLKKGYGCNQEFILILHYFSAIESDSLASLVTQRLDLEMYMRQILEVEQRLSHLTPESPDYTDGKLEPVTLQQLQEKVPFINWEDFLIKGFKIIDHELDPELTILIDQEYLQVTH